MKGPQIASIEDKYEKLSQKIFRIQNIELKNPIKCDNLDYQVGKFEVAMHQTVKDYEKKSAFLQEEMGAIKKLLMSKEEIRRLNRKRATDEMASVEGNLLKVLKGFREDTVRKVDNVMKSIEGSIEQMKERQRGSKEQLMLAIEKLKHITEVDMIKLKEDREVFSKENRLALTSTNQALVEEFQYIYSQVQQAKEMRAENEEKFIKDIQVEMNKIKAEVANAKAERLKLEEKIFGTLTETIERIQNSMS